MRRTLGSSKESQGDPSFCEGKIAVTLKELRKKEEDRACSRAGGGVLSDLFLRITRCCPRSLRRRRGNVFRESAKVTILQVLRWGPRLAWGKTRTEVFLRRKGAPGGRVIKALQPLSQQVPCHPGFALCAALTSEGKREITDFVGTFFNHLKIRGKRELGGGKRHASNVLGRRQ